MPVLARQLLTVPLGGDLDTEVADKILPLGKLLELENAVIDQTGRVSKRPGYSDLADPSGVVWQLATRSDALVSLTQTAAHPLEEYSPAGARWTHAAVVTQLRLPMSVDRLPVRTSADETVDHVDVAYNASAGFYVVASESQLGPGGDYRRVISIIDATTNQVTRRYAVDSAFAAGPTHPRVHTVGSYTVVVRHDAGGNLNADVFSSANLTADTTATTYALSALAHLTEPYADLYSANSTTLEVAYRSAANTTRRASLTVATGVVVDVVVTTAAAAAVNPSLALCWVQDFGGSGKYGIATAGPAGATVQWDLTGGTPASTIVLDVSATADIDSMTGHTISANAAGELVVIWSKFFGVTRAQSKLGKHLAAGVIAPVYFTLDANLVSKSFLHSSGDVYVFIGFTASETPALQPSVFMVRVDPDKLTNDPLAPLVRVQALKAVTFRTANCLSSVVQSIGSSFVVGLVSQTTFDTIASAAGVIRIGTLAELATVSFAPTLARAVDTGDTLVQGGGQLQSFDGRSYAEQGFSVRPHGLATNGVETPGFLSAGAYQWIWVYRYTDANGKIVRSKPSEPFAHTTVGGGGVQITITGPSLVLTSHISDVASASAGGSDVVIEQYRTTVGGPLFFLEATAKNNPALPADQGIVSTISDTTLQAGEPLYTTDGVLANDMTPPARAVTYFRDRVWLISSDDPSEVWASSPADTGLGFMFSDQFVVRKQDSRGGFTALAGMGLNLYMFKKSVIYAINGEGLNALGQGSFGEPQEIVNGLGTEVPASVCVTPVGIFFKGPLGFYLLSGGGPTYVGAPVQRYNSKTVLASEVFPTLNQVRFLCSDLTTLVYDWFHQQWIVHVMSSQTSAIANYGGSPTVAAAGGTSVEKQDTTGTTWTDLDGANYAVKITTPWIQPGGLEGIERIYEIRGVGDNHAAHTLRVTVRYDDDDGPTQVYEKTFAADDDWSWKLKLERQTATAVKITLQEIFPGGPGGRAFDAVAIVLLVGVEPSHLRRLQARVKALSPA